MSRFARTKYFARHTWASFKADAGIGVTSTSGPADDRWYSDAGSRSSAGPIVSPASALRVAAVFACARVVTETFGSLPINVYRQRKSGGHDIATDHPAQELFLRPNEWQTGMEFFEMMQGHLELRGNAYALKVSGNGRAIDQLTPIHPDRVRVFLLPNGRLRYDITSYTNGQTERYSQDEILHVRGWSFDGIMGISTVSAMAETIGVGLAQQGHRANYFRNGAIPGMVIETVKMTDEDREQMVNSISEKFSGDGAFKVMALPPGMKTTPLSLTSRDSQLIEASSLTRSDICGGFRVPPHKIGDLTRGTFSNIEQQNIEFATDGMRPRIVRFERRLDRDIVNALQAYESSPGDYFAVFNMDALMRGDIKSRYEAYAAALPWMLRNEMRAAEGKNPIDGLDEPLVAVNMETVDQAQKRSDANIAAKQDGGGDEKKNSAVTEQDLLDGGDSPADEEDDENAKVGERRVRAIAMAAAGRVVRREVKALRKLQGLSGNVFEHNSLLALYSDLAPVVADSMAITTESAKRYCNGQVLRIQSTQPALLEFLFEEIEDKNPVTLADLAISGISSKKALAQPKVH